MIESYSINEKRKKGRSLYSESTEIRYGDKEYLKNIQQTFLDILKTNDDEERYSKIDDLVMELEKDSNISSFFGRNERISILCGSLGLSDLNPGFKLDDMELYYHFVDAVKIVYDKYENPSLGGCCEPVIKYIIKDYLGKFNGDIKLREKLTTPTLKFKNENENDFDIIIPSIKDLYGQNCAMCVERASVAHNLWTLGGFQSTFVSSGSVSFDNPNKGHSYCIVKSPKSYRLFDPAMEVYMRLTDKNPCDEILEGKPFIVDVNNEKLVYANNNVLDQNLTPLSR